MKTQKQYIRDINYGIEPTGNLFVPLAVIASLVLCMVSMIYAAPLLHDLHVFLQIQGLSDKSGIGFRYAIVSVWLITSALIIWKISNLMNEKNRKEWYQGRDDIVKKLKINNILQVSTAGVFDHELSRSPWHYDVLGFLRNILNDPEWSFAGNSRCKYLDIRIDTRTGTFVVKDRDGNVITPMIAYWQYSKENPTPPENYLETEEK